MSIIVYYFSTHLPSSKRNRVHYQILSNICRSVALWNRSIHVKLLIDYLLSYNEIANKNKEKYFYEQTF